MTATLRLHASRVVTPGGASDAIVEIEDGRIAAVVPFRGATDLHGEGQVEDLGDAVLLPGFVDTHVHVNEPGRTAWEGWATASRAALAGGITTIVDMPLNSIPATTSVGALEAKRVAARASSRVDCGFWGGVVPGNTAELEPLAAAGVLGFKCFLVDSGVPEFPASGEVDLERAMPVLARLGLPLLVHAEDPRVVAAAPAPGPGEARRHAAWLASRPPEAEVSAIRMLIRLCAAHGSPVHVVHLTAAAALDDLREARAAGLPITVETCPHYLYFEAESIPDGATEFKCAPPIRGRENRERLWRALGESEIDMVASDHSPCPPELKRREAGDFSTAWGGIASLECAAAAVWTEARERGFGVEHLTRWMSTAPASLAGLGGRKGAIVPGADADLVLWDPDVTWRVDPRRLLQRHPVTPYANRTLTGRAVRVWRRGHEMSLSPGLAGDAEGLRAEFPVRGATA
jgi:allantoinase